MNRSFQTLRATLVALPIALTAAPALAKDRANGPAWCAARCDQVVIDWNAHAHQVIKAADGYRHPLAASRALAMMHLAMHDAANAAEPRYRPHTYAPQAHAPQGAADAAVAAAVAAHDVLLALYPQQQPLLRATLDALLHDAGHGPAVQAGQALGAAAAAAMVARRADDGSNQPANYVPGSQPGEYRHVPGATALFAPHWRAVQPFSLGSPAQFRVAPPPALGSARYAADFLEVKSTGSKAPDAHRSADQTASAAFWYEFSEAGWNRIARTVARRQPQDLWARARSFALLNAALADSYIAGWDSKLHHNLWRPVTAIRLAADDGNAATVPDEGWNPLLPTPPVQDHPSTHSALGAAAAVVLAHSFGRDRIAFTVSSPTALAEAPSRSFPSFSAAALDNADSRVRAGLHFRFATNAGLELGRRIGQHVLQTMLRPVAEGGAR